jgi:hypothetical protein
MRRSLALLTLVVTCGLGLTTGCASRQGVSALARTQDEFFTRMADRMKTNRDLLRVGLEEQLASDRVRQQNLLEWQRDLEKAEVILQQRSGDVTGEERLLSMKLAEADLNAVARLNALRGIDTARRDAILALYDKVAAAAAAVAQNNKTILQYVDSRDAAFALRSLDVTSLVQSTTLLREAGSTLGVVKRQSEEEERKQAESLQKAIERARDVLIKVYAK